MMVPVDDTETLANQLFNTKFRAIMEKERIRIDSEVHFQRKVLVPFVFAPRQFSLALCYARVAESVLSRRHLRTCPSTS